MKTPSSPPDSAPPAQVDDRVTDAWLNLYYERRSKDQAPAHPLLVRWWDLYSAPWLGELENERNGYKKCVDDLCRNLSCCRQNAEEYVQTAYSKSHDNQKLPGQRLHEAKESARAYIYVAAYHEGLRQLQKNKRFGTSVDGMDDHQRSNNEGLSTPPLQEPSNSELEDLEQLLETVGPFLTETHLRVLKARYERLLAGGRSRVPENVRQAEHRALISTAGIFHAVKIGANEPAKLEFALGTLVDPQLRNAVRSAFIDLIPLKKEDKEIRNHLANALKQLCLEMLANEEYRALELLPEVHQQVIDAGYDSPEPRPAARAAALLGMTESAYKRALENALNAFRRLSTALLQSCRSKGRQGLRDRIEKNRTRLTKWELRLLEAVFPPIHKDRDKNGTRIRDAQHDLEQEASGLSIPLEEAKSHLETGLAKLYS